MGYLVKTCLLPPSFSPLPAVAVGGQHVARCSLQQESSAGQPGFVRLSLAEYVAVEAKRLNKSLPAASLKIRMGRREAVELRTELQPKPWRIFWFKPSYTMIYLLLSAAAPL